MNNLLCLVEDICKTEITMNIDYYEKYYLPYGDYSCVNVGALTTQVASRSRYSTNAARYRLKKLVEQGLLLEKKTSGGISRWWPVGLAKKLNSIK